MHTPKKFPVETGTKQQLNPIKTEPHLSAKPDFHHSDFHRSGSTQIASWMGSARGRLSPRWFILATRHWHNSYIPPAHLHIALSIAHAFCPFRMVQYQSAHPEIAPSTDHGIYDPQIVQCQLVHRAIALPMLFAVHIVSGLNTPIGQLVFSQSMRFVVHKGPVATTATVIKLISHSPCLLPFASIHSGGLFASYSHL